MAASPAAAQVYWQVASYNVPVYGCVTWVSALLAGGVVLQCIDYMQHATRDAAYLKTMVLITTAAQVITSAFELLGHTAQVNAAMGQEIKGIVLIPWTQSAVVLGTVISGLISQMYFARIIHRMTRAPHLPQRQRTVSRAWSTSWIVAFCILCTSVLIGGIGAALTFARIDATYFNPVTAKVELMGTPLVLYAIWLTSAAVLDMALSSILIGRFLQDVRKDGFEATNSLLTSLAISTLETFSLTAVLSLADLACAVAANFADYVTIPKLEIGCYILTVMINRAYAASFIFTLKRHAAVRDRRLVLPQVAGSLHLTSTSGRNMPGQAPQSSQGSTPTKRSFGVINPFPSKGGEVATNESPQAGGIRASLYGWSRRLAGGESTPGNANGAVSRLKTFANGPTARSQKEREADLGADSIDSGDDSIELHDPTATRSRTPNAAPSMLTTDEGAPPTTFATPRSTPTSEFEGAYGRSGSASASGREYLRVPEGGYRYGQGQAQASKVRIVVEKATTVESSLDYRC